MFDSQTSVGALFGLLIFILVLAITIFCGQRIAKAVENLLVRTLEWLTPENAQAPAEQK